MTLPDRPPDVVRWQTGLEPDLLKALGELAVASAHMEELLHQLYWKHAGLDDKSGPIVTDNLNPKRLAEDIKKLVALDPAKITILEDLKILFREFEDINTKRNHCLHWIWSVIETNETPRGSLAEMKPDVKFPPYKVSRPAYKQSGVHSQEFEVKDIEEICQNCNWLVRRLYSHALSDDSLRQFRDIANDIGTTTERSLADLFWPAPWLD